MPALLFALTLKIVQAFYTFAIIGTLFHCGTSSQEVKLTETLTPIGSGFKELQGESGVVIVSETENHYPFISEIDFDCRSSDGISLRGPGKITRMVNVTFMADDIGDTEFVKCIFKYERRNVAQVVVYARDSRIDLLPFPCSKYKWNVDTRGFFLYNDREYILKHVYNWTRIA